MTGSNPARTQYGSYRISAVARVRVYYPDLSFSLTTTCEKVCIIIM